MEKEKINRINQLAKLSKERALTAEEKANSRNFGKSLSKKSVPMYGVSWRALKSLIKYNKMDCRCGSPFCCTSFSFRVYACSCIAFNALDS